jgi:hypothetical protein
MKRIILFFLLVSGFADAQPCILPPPPGYNPIYALDYDNDGYAIFDIDWYVNNYTIPVLVDVYGITPESYYYTFTNINGTQPPPTAYANVVLDEWSSIDYNYSGSGPTIEPLPPCYWLVEMSMSVRLIPVPVNGDVDNDGILNGDEDTNGNGNLMDDDQNADGWPNVLDTTNTLGTAVANSYHFKVSNPVTNGLLVFESDAAISEVSAYDSLGRKIALGKVIDNSVALNGLTPGTYFMVFQSGNITITKTIIVQ